MKTVSIVIPAYNEGNFIATLLEKILQVPTEDMGFAKQIIVVDDGSTDATAERASAFAEVQVIQQQNQGKGAAVQRGVQEATGDFILVQDADLEYDPADYLPMLEELGRAERRSVYGSRPLGIIRDCGWRWPFPGRHADQGLGPWVMNIVLVSLFLLLFRRWITDSLTAYKIYPTALIKSFSVKTCGFETDHELTCKLLKAGISIVEVPIAYEPRSLEEGKKIRPLDGLIALWTIVRFRFVD